MTMKKLIYIIVAAAAVGAIGCERGDSGATDPTGKAIELSVGVSATRAGITDATISEVGVYVEGTATLSNLHLTKTSGAWSFDNAPILWPAGSTYAVKAYAPYNATGAAITIAANQSTDLDAYDIVCSSASGISVDDHTVATDTYGTTSWSDSKLAIELKHAASKLVFNITYQGALVSGGAVAGVSGQSLTVGGKLADGTTDSDFTTASFAPSSCTFTFGDTAGQLYTAFANAADGATQQFEVIVPPMQSKEGAATTTTVPVRFSFTYAKGTASEKAYTFTKNITGLDLSQGKQYTVSFNCTLQGLQVGSVTLTDWETGDAITDITGTIE